MQILKPGVEPERFFAELRTAARRLLMLDYDGTLAPFRIERDQALPYPGVRERLSALTATPATRVVLISGRMAREVAQLAAISPAPEVWGTHGWERLHADGRYELATLPAEAVQGLHGAAQALGQDWGERLEHKPASVAFHARSLAGSRRTEALADVQQRWSILTGRHGLELHEFDGGLELRVPGRSKGTAVRALLAESNAGPACAYLGDDRTDEDAFAAIAGHGLGVLVRSEPRDTAAAWWLKPPGELLDFIDHWIAACQDAP